MKETLEEQYNRIVENLKNQPRYEPIYYMNKEGLKHLDEAIMAYAKANNITIEDDKTTNSK